MNDPLNDKLTLARPANELDPHVKQALDALVLRTTSSQVRQPRRRALRVLSAGAALTVAGAGAVAASPWSPWTFVPEPDLVITREWTDVNGNELGTCQSHLALDALTDEQASVARDLLTGFDVDAMQPNAELVASMLVAVDRPEDMSSLIEGAQVTDFDVSHTGPFWDESWSNAKILQAGLERTAFGAIAREMIERWPALENTFGGSIETQCSTDPSWVRGS